MHRAGAGRVREARRSRREGVGEVQKFDGIEWKSQICKLAGCSNTTLYERRAEWMAAYNVDMAIPRAFYRDLRTYSPASLILPEGRDALLAARDQQDGDETLRLLDDADGDFFSLINEVVGKAISSPPTLLPTKVAGETLVVGEPAADAIASKPSPNRGHRLQGPLGKPANGQSGSTSQRDSRINRAGANKSPTSSAVASASSGKPKVGRLSPKPPKGHSLPKPAILDPRDLNSHDKMHRAIAQARAELRSAQTEECATNSIRNWTAWTNLLATRPVLFALARALGEAWPGDAPRSTLLARAFRAKHADESHRARLRVEVGAASRRASDAEDVRATKRGFALAPRRAREVAVLRGPSTSSMRRSSPSSPTASLGRARPSQLRLAPARAPSSGRSIRLRRQARCSRLVAGERVAG